MSEVNVAGDQLRLFIERIERLEEEKKGISEDIKDVYLVARAKAYIDKAHELIALANRIEAMDRKVDDASIFNCPPDSAIRAR